MQTIVVSPTVFPVNFGTSAGIASLNPFTLPVVMAQEAVADMGARRRRRRSYRRSR